jgi:hypothetical protein
MAGFDVTDRDQGQAQVARFLEQAIERGLVGYGAVDDGGAVAVVGAGQPVEPGALLLLSLAWMDLRRRCEPSRF